MSKNIPLKELEQIADGWTTVERQKSDRTFCGHGIQPLNEPLQTEDLT
jgi:hypothetical protein